MSKNTPEKVCFLFSYYISLTKSPKKTTYINLTYTIMKKSILIFICVFSLTFSAKAQDDFEKILLAKPADANKLMQGYFAPAMEGFTFAMNNGWYHTAKVHKVLGFDLTIGLSGAMIPSSKEVFTASGLTSVTGGSYTGPTFAGSENGNSITVNNSVNGNPVSGTFTMPGGVAEDLPLKAIPAPVAQLNIGLPFKMEAMLRFFPETDLGDDGGKAKMLGLGLKKEITSWFGPLDKLPLHVSLLAAYTSMDVSYGFTSSNDINVSTGSSAELSLKAYTVQAIASLNFPFINIYGGFGYGSGNSTLKMNGQFTPIYNGVSGTALSDPINLDFDASGVKTTIGARISLGFFKIFADYTLQEYNTLSAGIALSIR